MLALLCAVASGWATLVASAGAGRLNRIPLLNPTVANTTETLAVVALVGSWASRRRRWLTRTLPLIVVGAVVLTSGIATVLRLTGTVTDPYPPSFAIWVATALAAALSLPVVLPRAGMVRRGLAALGVPLALVGTLLLINNEYGAWPTLGDLLGHTRILSPSALSLRSGALASRHGVLVAVDPPATTSHFHHRPGSVYLPPAYFTEASPKLPVIIMLAGTPGSTIQWPTAGRAVDTADAYAATHHGRAPVLLFVDHNGAATADTECADGPQGNAETFLTVDVPTFITQTLRIRRNPSRWAVAGFSEGGTCALDLVLAHPTLFRHLVDLDGDAQPTLGGPAHTLAALFGGSVRIQKAHNPAHLLAIHQYAGVTAWFATGIGDQSRIPVAQKLARAASKADILTHEMTAPGGHNWQFASTAFAQLAPQLCTQLGLPDN